MEMFVGLNERCGVNVICLFDDCDTIEYCHFSQIEIIIIIVSFELLLGANVIWHHKQPLLKMAINTFIVFENSKVRLVVQQRVLV